MTEALSSSTRTQKPPAEAAHLVPVYHCLPFLGELHRRGLDSRRAIALLGICSPEGHARAERLAEPTFRAFLRLTEAISNDACIGLVAGQHIALADAVHFDLRLSSPAYGEIGHQYFDVSTQAQNALTLDISLSDTAIVCALRKSGLAPSRLLSGYVLAAIVSCTRQAFGDVAPLEVQLTGPAPKLKVDTYQRSLGTRLTFAAKRDAVLLPLQLLSRPSLQAGTSALELALTIAQTALQAQEAPPASPYAATVLNALKSCLVMTSQRGL